MKAGNRRDPHACAWCEPLRRRLALRCTYPYLAPTPSTTTGSLPRLAPPFWLPRSRLHRLHCTYSDRCCLLFPTHIPDLVTHIHHQRLGAFRSLPSWAYYASSPIPASAYFRIDRLVPFFYSLLLLCLPLPTFTPPNPHLRIHASTYFHNQIRWHAERASLRPSSHTTFPRRRSPTYRFCVCLCLRLRRSRCR